MEISELRVGLIGAGGGMSRLRGAALQANPRTTVAAACSVNEEHWPRVREQYGLNPVTDYEELVSSDTVDAIIVSTPNTLHFDQIQAALRHGKHVLCEYPMVQTLGEYDALAELAAGKGLVLHDGLTPVVEDYYLAFKENVAKVGRTLTMSFFYYVGKVGWYWKERLAGNPFVIIHMHQLAQAMDLFGEVESVYAGMRSFDLGEGESRGLPTIVKFREGTFAVLNVGVGSGAAPDYTITLIGDEGLLQFRTDCKPPKFVTKVGGQAAEETELLFDFTKWFRRDTDSFVDEVLDGGAPTVDLARGREVLRICLLCSESAERGQAVEA